MERATNELAKLKMTKDMEERERRAAKDLEEEAELRRAKDELQGIKHRQTREEEEKRIRKELEFKRFKEEEREAAEQEKREKEAEAAVERYKQKETERMQREKKDKELQEKEYQRRLKDHLFQSGLDEEHVEAIMKNKKIPEPKEEPQQQLQLQQQPRYTRLARKHLSLETLRVFDVAFTVDDKVRCALHLSRRVIEDGRLTHRLRMRSTCL